MIFLKIASMSLLFSYVSKINFVYRKYKLGKNEKGALISIWLF